MQTLVGGKYRTKIGITSGYSHLWEANIEPKLELPVDTVTCGRRQTWNQKFELPVDTVTCGREKQTHQSSETLLQRTLNIDDNII